MKKISLIISGLFFSLLFLLTFTGQAWTADCLAIRKKIEKETDLLQRKELAKQGISDCPNDPIINFEFAYSMERFRKYKLALKHYQIAAKLAPKYGKSYFGMGDMYMNLERPGDAVKAYQAGLSLDPSNKRAKISIKEAKKAAKKQGGGDDGIAAFENPLAPAASSKPKKTARKSKKTSQVSNPLPYEPAKALILQEPEIMKPIVATPLKSENLQNMNFDKAGHSDITGSLDDNQMGAD
ncbi:MAG: tetratricopeptide repeat protein [Thermodesulfobacteriota bacterium]